MSDEPKNLPRTSWWEIKHAPDLTLILRAGHDGLTVSIVRPGHYPGVYDRTWDDFHRPPKTRAMLAQDLCEEISKGIGSVLTERAHRIYQEWHDADD